MTTPFYAAKFPSTLTYFIMRTSPNQTFATRVMKSLVKIFLVILFMNISINADATHFRYGNLTWSRVSGNTIRFKLTESWRRGYPWNGYLSTNPLNPNPGQIINFNGNFPLNFGDGTFVNVILTVTSISAADDWIFGEFIVDHTFATTGSFLAFMEGSARLSSPANLGLLQNNGDLSFRVESLVTVGNNNDAPVSTLPPIVNMIIGNLAATYQIPATDPNGDALTFSLAPSASFTQAGFSPLCTQPQGFSVSATGLISFNTTNAFY